MIGGMAFIMLLIYGVARMNGKQKEIITDNR
jgi:hypothetical protein